jgi:hypothetical protein
MKFHEFLSRYKVKNDGRHKQVDLTAVHLVFELSLVENECRRIFTWKILIDKFCTDNVRRICMIFHEFSFIY